MDKPAKLPYTKPVLIRYGSIVEMTTGGSIGPNESMFPMCAGPATRVCIP